MKTQSKKAATKRASSKKAAKKTTKAKSQPRSANQHGYKILAKVSKPDFSEEMISKMMAASKH